MRAQSVISVLTVLLHAAAVALFAVGIFWAQKELCSHHECTMTYSRRRFLPIALLGTPDALPYRLYKFYDERDPRHAKLKDDKSPTQSTNSHCMPNATIVVFIPGHLGDYQQSRSLGAHGIQLTRQQTNPRQLEFVTQSLQEHLWHGKSKDLNAFVYDVYALDFHEEHGGLHGDILQRQADFLQLAIRQLVQDCGVDNILPVAHSIGGYALRLALTDYPELRSSVPTMITLGTPHRFPVWALDPSMALVHRRLYEHTNILSLSGGLADEMIPPLACQAHVTIYVADVAHALTHGTDHRALVWCHDVLEILRQVIFRLAHTVPSDHRAVLEVEFQGPSHDDSLGSQKELLRAKHDFWKSTAMESGLLHNLELLVIIFTLLTTVHSLGNYHDLFVVLVVALYSHLTSASDASVSPQSITLLTLVANTTYQIIVTFLQLCDRALKRWPQRRVFVATGVFSAVVSMALAVLSQRFLWSNLQLADAAFFGFGILFSCAVTVMAPWMDSASLSFRSMLIVLIPVLSAGEVARITTFGTISRYSPSLVLCLSVVIRSLVGLYRPAMRLIWTPWVHLVVIFALHLTDRGSTYRLLYYVSFVCWWDVFGVVLAPEKLKIS